MSDSRRCHYCPASMELPPKDGRKAAARKPSNIKACALRFRAGRNRVLRTRRRTQAAESQSCQQPSSQATCERLPQFEHHSAARHKIVGPLRGSSMGTPTTSMGRVRAVSAEPSSKSMTWSSWQLISSSSLVINFTLRAGVRKQRKTEY